MFCCFLVCMSFESFCLVLSFNYCALLSSHDCVVAICLTPCVSCCVLWQTSIHCTAVLAQKLMPIHTHIITRVNVLVYWHTDLKTGVGGNAWSHQFELRPRCVHSSLSLFPLARTASLGLPTRRSVHYRKWYPIQAVRGSLVWAESRQNFSPSLYFCMTAQDICCQKALSFCSRSGVRACQCVCVCVCVCRCSRAELCVIKISNIICIVPCLAKENTPA